VRTTPRPRRYVSPAALTLCRPVMAFDLARDAYVLRVVGRRLGPVLREDRRRGRASGRAAGAYAGPERRRDARGADHGHRTLTV
jgi:hypothetical protein